MILKSIEIQGFKSFPDKTVLMFNDGVNTVVGPNGSGKSNVAEAVRWVLGEQSAKSLRCDKKMEELIFHGTQHRGPVGFCEVTIRLDNTTRVFPDDNDEMAVTRRLYRSGESEYYINKQSVRLKDVLDLFLGTGLGRDGYSIIGQGRISEILSDKGTDRRRVFEEAAGISRFRVRKEDAERKLQHAEDNLVRIQDKIDELELQREPLKEQSERARTYLKFHDEQRVLEINVWLNNLDRIRGDTDRLRRDFDALNSDLEQGHKTLEDKYAEAERLSERHAEQQLAVDGVRSELSRNEVEAQELVGRGDIIRTNIAHAEENIARLNEELEGSSGRYENLERQTAEREEKLKDLTSILAGINAELEAAIAETQARAEKSGDLEATLAKSRLDESEALARANEARDALSTLEALSGEMTARRQTVMTELAVRNQTHKESLNELSSIDSDIKTAKENSESLQNVIEGYKIRVGARNVKATELRGKHTELEREIHAVESRAGILRDMEREYEGFPRAVKSVMNGNFKGVLGTVAELIRVEDKYAVAIETALGSALQNIVVESEDVAKECIRHLKSRNIGRATFLPISAVHGEKTEDRGKESIGLASDLVSYDKKLEGVMLQLLGRTLVANDMDSAVEIARNNRFRVRLVTLDGQVISAGGAMTGGAAAQNVGTLSRRNELERLEAKLEELKEKYQAAERELKNAERELSAAQYELNVAEDERRDAELAVTTLNSERQHKQTWTEQLAAAIKILHDELGGVSERIELNAQKTEELNKTIDAEQRSAAELRQKTIELESAMDEMDTQHADLSRRITDARAEQAGVQAEISGTERAIEEYREFKEQLYGDSEQKENAIKEQLDKKEDYKQQLEALADEIADCENAHEEIRKQLMAAVQQSMELEAERARADRDTKDINEQNLKLEREVARLESKRAAGEQEERLILERLWENYGLAHQDALKQRTEIESVPVAQRRIAELKREIEALGVVNIGAIDEFKRVNERYEYLTLQSDDARKSKTELLGILDEIVNAMKEIFSEKFALISERFVETFLEIFGGGQAYLELEDPEDLLNTGIEIRVQPPGKKLGALAPLSGGERSLVAIALYFAIFKVNPAPFCVLDEVDHDLDEINVTRYADYLKRMSEHLQFVVITHRRGTMEVANYIYGVTSEQQGVSKILALDIAEVERALGLRLK
ncbi:MAG: chromosome segregation protein SMC [Oscillospiraceae bacterium]|nr:chromosome segregation protein SMC [Oscillospiraceae bacterium]